MTISLPNELLLETFSWFPLKCLLAARGVCRSWRHLVPLASIPPARRALMDLYYDVIEKPYFLCMRDKVIMAVEPFNREEYVAALEQQLEGTLPAEFRSWVLEWPEKAVFGWSWPGLSTRFDSKLSRKNRLHINCATINLLNSDDNHGGRTDLEVDDIRPRLLKVWDHRNWGATWLVVDSTEPSLYGTLLQLDHIFMYLRPPVALSWVEWLRQKPEFRHSRVPG